MNKLKKFFISLLLVFILVPIFNINVNAENNFVINNYDVVIDVNEKGVYTITETLDVKFTRESHGIYLNIPTRYENYNWNVDGQYITKSYNFPISHIKVLSNHEYDVERESNGVSIKIGSPDYYANTNEKYVVTYKVHSTDLGLNGVQTFYYNIISTTWNTDILNSTFTINMPKPFDVNKVNFYTDNTEKDENLKYTVEGNTIKGSLNSIINYGRGITIKLDVEKNYFDYSLDYMYLYIGIGISALILILVIISFWKYGRDDKVIQTVEFEAPKELSSAGCGYVYKGFTSNKDIISLLLYWANKGLITVEDNKNYLTFTKINELTDGHSYEMKLFRGLFTNDKITTKEITKKYNLFQDTIYDIYSYFHKKENRLFSSISDGIQALFMFVLGIPIGLCVSYTMYLKTYDSFTSLVLGGAVYVAMIASMLLLSNVITSFSDNIFKSMGKVLGILFSILIAIVCSLILPSFAIIAFWLINIISIVFVGFMRRRSEIGIKLYGKVLGLRDFIIHAEKDRIEMLFNDDPKIFYKILPYAYALDLTEAWSEHFENFEIEKPDWYYGDDFSNYYFYNSMVRNLAVASKPIPPVSSKSNGGGGFSGGGFSGGGFSGGGFGGSSGGSW